MISYPNASKNSHQHVLNASIQSNQVTSSSMIANGCAPFALRLDPPWWYEILLTVCCSMAPALGGSDPQTLL